MDRDHLNQEETLLKRCKHYNVVRGHTCDGALIEIPFKEIV